MTVDIAPHRKQADSIVKSMLDPRNSVMYVLIYKISMEEARWGAVYPNAFTPVLMIEGKCSRLRAKPAHLVGHLPDLKPIFVEYARCFKGRKQLTYSPHLKSFYNLEEKSDEELAAEVQEEAVTLVMLTPGQWAQVVGNDIRGELLEVARAGEVLAVVGYLEGFGIEGVTPIAIEQPPDT